MRGFRSDTGVGAGAVENNWKKDQNGESYRQRLSAAGRSDVLDWATTTLADAVKRVDDAFAEKYGWTRRDEGSPATEEAAAGEEGRRVTEPAGPELAQGELFGDPYADIETRPGTTEAQRDVGREALAAAEARIFGRVPSRLRQGATLLGSRISRDFRAQGGISLVGQQVSSPRDLAVLAQVLRDPPFETVRAFYVDSTDRVIGERAPCTSRARW